MTVEDHVSSCAKTRVAVVQLGYLPAALQELYSPLEDPLFGVGPGQQDTFHLPGDAPGAVVERIQALRERVRQTYCEQLRPRLRAILQQCGVWRVEVVVFPEYSIPWQLLEELAAMDAVSPMVVVAGTHAVDLAAHGSGMYERLGGQTPELGMAVCPVLHCGRLIGLQPKLNRSKLEPELEPGGSWAPIALPGTLPSLGVLICLDFLYREGAQHREWVAPRLEECRFLAVPSLTPHYTLPEFAGKAWEEARRYRRPVLYADGASGGGTTIYVDEGAPRELRDFPRQAGFLERDDEGVIVADVDLGYEAVGESTVYAQERPVVPVAAANLVYRARRVGDAYGQFLEELAPLLGERGGDAVAKVLARLREARALLVEAGAQPGMAACRERLRRLLADLGRITSMEKVRCFTREVVLPREVLPPALLRAALARGAYEAVVEWQKEFPTSGLEAIARRLAPTAAAAKAGQEGWTVEGWAASERVADAVRGEARAGESRALETYRTVVLSDLVSEEREAVALYQAEKYEDALGRFREVRERARQLAAQDAEGHEKLKRRAAGMQLNMAACLQALGENEEARQLLVEIEPHDLPPERWEALVKLLGQLGERGRAWSILREREPFPGHEGARLLLEILEGRLPGAPPDEPAFVFLAASRLLDQGRAATAARWVLAALDKGANPGGNVLGATGLLFDALTRTVWERPGLIEPVAASERAALLACIETNLEQLLGRVPPLPGRLRKEALEVAARYYSLTEDDERREHACAALAAAGTPLEPEEQEVAQLFREGRLEEAEARMPRHERPWIDEFARVEGLLLSRRRKEALERCEVLAREYPGRAPVEYLAAKLFLWEGRRAEALEHARAAFQELPGRGYRLLLAQCLLRNREGEEAWQLLEGLADARSREMLNARAWAAQYARPSQAIERWKEYLAGSPEDVSARVHLAVLLGQLGRREEAELLAREIMEGSENTRLTAAELGQIALLQRLDGPHAAQSRVLVEKIAEQLRTRFPGEPEAEGIRLNLLALLGFPESSEPIDYEGLARAGVVSAISMEDWIERRKAYAALNQWFLLLYRTGRLSFEGLCEETGISAATYVGYFASSDVDALSTPVGLVTWPGALDLAQGEWLIGELELLILQRLGLLGRLREALGRTGRLVLFDDVLERLYRAAQPLMAEVQLRERDRIEALVQKLLELSARGRVEWGANLPEADWDWARSRGLPVLHDEPTPERLSWIIPGALARRLVQERYLDLPTCERLLKLLPEAARTDMIHSDPLPVSLLITASTLKAFHRAGALEALLEALAGRLVIGPDAVRALLLEQEDLRKRAARFARAQELQDWVGQGIQNEYVRRFGARPVEELPEPTYSDVAEVIDRSVREPLQRALAWKKALVDRPQLRLVTADFFVAAIFDAAAPVDLVQSLRFTREQLENLVKRMRAVRSQVMTLPQLVSELLPEPGTQGDKLLDLVKLGFHGALRSSTLLSLMRRPGGIEGVGSKHLLGRAEWMARAEQHPGSIMARLSLANTYAQATWSAWIGLVVESHGAEKPRKLRLEEEECRAVTRALLERSEALDPVGSSVLDKLLDYILEAAIKEPRLSFRREEGATTPLLAEDSPAGHLWSTILAWSGQEGRRRGAFGRVFREVACELDKQAPAEGPSDVQQAPLMLAYRATKGARDPFALISPEAQTLTILAATWRERPLANNGVHIRDAAGNLLFSVDLETLLQEAAKGWEVRSLDVEPNEWLAYFPVMAPSLGEVGRALVPTEALLLRMSPLALQEHARALARVQGLHDGRSHARLERLAQSPEDVNLRREVAREAVRAPWRLVREDPLILVRWGRLHWQVPKDLEALCELLSEPMPPLPEQDLVEVLLERGDPGGLWQKRSDLLELRQQAAEIPGRLCLLALPSRLHSDHLADEVAEAWDRLDHSHEQPAACLEADIVFLRLAAVHQPVVELPAGTVDLRETLAGRLVALLESVTEPPPPESLATVEAGILRLCGRVVEELASPRVLSLRDGLWLTYRLFQWYVAQLQALVLFSPSGYRAALKGLGAVVPPPWPPDKEVRDVLDPFGFSRERFDQRLAAVLYGLATMEQAAWEMMRQEGGSKPRPLPISSEALLVKLADIVTQSLTAVHIAVQNASQPSEEKNSCLGWNRPSAVPDLALLALLSLDVAGFFRLAPAARLQFIEALPSGPDTAAAVSSELTNRIFLAVTQKAEELTAEERVLLKARAQVAMPGYVPDTLRGFVLAHLLGLGELELRQVVRSLLLDRLDDDKAPLLFAEYVHAISQVAVSETRAEIDRLLGELGERDPVPFVHSLGLVALSGSPEGQRIARETLQELGSQAPYRDQEKILDLLQHLGLGGK